MELYWTVILWKTRYVHYDDQINDEVRKLESDTNVIFSDNSFENIFSLSQVYYSLLAPSID